MNIFPTLQPKDLIALLMIAGIIVLKVTKVDTGFDTYAALIIGYYFGQRHTGDDTGN